MGVFRRIVAIFRLCNFVWIVGANTFAIGRRSLATAGECRRKLGERRVDDGGRRCRRALRDAAPRSRFMVAEDFRNRRRLDVFPRSSGRDHLAGALALEFIERRGGVIRVLDVR